MKIAIITDTHFGARNDSVQFDEYFYQFYEGQFFPYLQKHNIKTVIHLGDVLDRRKFVSYRIAKNFRERFILPFQALDIELHALCLLYTSPSPRDRQKSRMPSSA